jgi:hypothetical protein
MHMRRLTLLGSALALGFIVCTSATASACSWRGTSNCAGDDYDQPVYGYYPPRHAYDYYVIVPGGPPGSGYRLLRAPPPSRNGLFPPQVYYYGSPPPPAYDYAPSYGRRYHGYDYDDGGRRRW